MKKQGGKTTHSAPAVEWAEDGDRLRWVRDWVWQTQIASKVRGEAGGAPRAFTDFKSNLVTGQTSVLGLWWYPPPREKPAKNFHTYAGTVETFQYPTTPPVLLQVSRRPMGVKEMILLLINSNKHALKCLKKSPLSKQKRKPRVIDNTCFVANN